MSARFYKRGTSDYLGLNANPDYCKILLKDVNGENYDGRKALDFACGKGRDIRNLLSLANWELVDGSDLSPPNIEHCKQAFPRNSSFFLTSGTDAGPWNSNYCDFIMATISLQHIPVYEIRSQILQDILRILKPGSRFSFQIGFGSDLSDPFGSPRGGYLENSYHAISANGDRDVRVISIVHVEDNLAGIGFDKISSQIRESFSDAGHPQWIYIHCFKPLISNPLSPSLLKSS
jgi:ubiquinone/menaquinone biosynthesis C-methylase UbiE